MKHLTAAITALGLVLGATTHAHALPIGVAIAGAIGLAGTAATIVGAAITLAIGIGLQFIAGALMRKRGSADVGGTTGKMQTGGVVPRSFPFGEKSVVTHSPTYRNSFGQDGKTPNAYHVIEFALSDLPVGGGRAALQEIWPNGTKATWDPEATPGTYGIAIPEFNKDGTDYMWVEVFDGTQTEADSLLVSLFENDANWPYADTRVGFGIVKIRIITRLQRDLFGGGAVPSFKFVVKGVPFYDAREDDTAGGEGDQRWSDDSTWAATENPVVVMQNLIRGVSYDGEWFFGGQTVSAAQLPSSAWFAAANECDAEIENEDETTEAQFRCAGEIRLDMEPADVIDDLLRACNGRIGEIGGVYKPHVGAAGTAVLSITDDDIRTDEDQTFEPFFGLQDIVNSINAKYIEPGEGWTAKDAPALVDAALEAEDGGRRQPVDLQYEYVPFARQVQRQNRATLTDYRRERRHVLPLAPEAWRLEPAIDFIAWTSERNGYTAKLFSVEGATDMDGYLVGVTLKEVDPGDYDDWTSTAPVIAPSPIVFAPSQGIAGADIDGVTVEGAGGRAKAGALLQWAGADQDDVRAVAFEIRVDGETDLTYSGETPESAVSQGTYIVTANLNGATDYEGRLKFVPFTGRATTWSDWINFTTPDVRVTEAELEAAVQDTLAKVDVIEQDGRDLAKSLSPNAPTRAEVAGKFQNNLHEAVRNLGLALGYALARIEQTSGTLRDAGITIDPVAGTVRIEAVDRLRTTTSTQFSEVSALFDAVNALISLRATKSDLDAAIEAVVAGFQPAYRYEFNGTNEGWTGSNATLTPGTGSTVIAGTGAGAYAASPTLSLDADTNKIVAIKVRRTAGTGWGLALQWGAGFANSRAFPEPAVPGDLNIIRLDQNGQTDWEGTLTDLRLAVANGSSFEVDYIEIGNSALNDLIVGELSARVSDLEIELDAANAAISLRATLAELGAATDRITVAELAIDAAQAAISGKVSNTTFEGVEARVTTAEFKLDAIENQISFSIGAIQDKSPLIKDLALADSKGQIDAFLRNQTVDQALAYARQILGARIDENGAALANFGLALIALTNSTAARFTEEITTRATLTDALAARASTLEATVYNPTTGLVDRTAAVETSVAAKVDESGATTVAQTVQNTRFGVAGEPGSVEAQIETIESTKVDEEGATAVAQNVLDAKFGAGSAKVKMRLGAVATPSGYDAFFQIEASVTGEDGTFKGTGQFIGVLTVGGTQIAVVEYLADRFRIKRPSDGATVLAWNSEDEVLSIFGGVYEGGAFRSENGRLVIDGGDEPLITFKNPSGAPVLYLGYYPP